MDRDEADKKPLDTALKIGYRRISGITSPTAFLPSHESPPIIFPNTAERLSMIIPKKIWINNKNLICIIILSFAALWLLPVATMAARGNIVIIANNKLPFTELSKKEIRNIFLGKYVHWESGERVEFAVLEKSGDTANIHALFTRDYLNKSPKQYLYYWKKMMFTGKGTPPKSFENESRLLDYVGSTEGAIGYISKSALKENEIQKIKKIRVTE